MRESNTRTLPLLALLATALILTGCSPAKPNQQSSKQQSIEKVAPIRNMQPVSEHVVLAGEVRAGGLKTLQDQHFDAVVDLRTPAEGVAVERKLLQGSGIEYVNLPTRGKLPSPQQMQAFSDTMHRLDGKKVLLHCHSGNRAGMMWGLYLTDQGVPLNQVLNTVKNSTTKASIVAIIKQHATDVAQNSAQQETRTSVAH